MTTLEHSLKISMIAGVIALVLVQAGAALAENEKGLSIGEQLPTFALKDYEGKEHSLADHVGKTVVLVFSSHECPWSKGADATLKDLAKKYIERGIVFFGIDSHRTTSPAAIRTYAQKQEIPFPILKDTDNKYADRVGATRTPEIYIVNKDGKLVYHGAYDNRKAPDEVGDVNYVSNALESMLAGEPVQDAEVEAWGCTIKRIAKRSAG